MARIPLRCSLEFPIRSNNTVLDMKRRALRYFSTITEDNIQIFYDGEELTELRLLNETLLDNAQIEIKVGGTAGGAGGGGGGAGGGGGGAGGGGGTGSKDHNKPDKKAPKSPPGAKPAQKPAPKPAPKPGPAPQKDLADRTLCICKPGYNDLNPENPGTQCVKADFRPTTTTTTPSTTTTTTQQPCGNTVCRLELNEGCIENQCVCPPGQYRQDKEKPCSDVVEIRMPLWVLRFNNNPLTFNNSFADSHSDVCKQYAEVLEKGIAASFEKAPCGPSFTSSQLKLIKNPKEVNCTIGDEAGGGGSGLWMEFVARFVKGSAPDPADCWRQLINVISKQFNFSVGGTPLFINPLSPDIACFQNDCPHTSWCIPQPDGHYQCNCPNGCKDDDPSKPGRKCSCDACLSPSTNNCHKNANCAPLDGGKTYNCSCKVGYVDKRPLRGGPGRECVPDFCVDLPFCPEKNASCVNYGDRAECECLEGFEDVRKSPNKNQFGSGDVFCLKPVDVNECQLRIDECVAPSVCANLQIGYGCQCPNGKNIAPGIICPAESRALCEQCSYHGSCVSYDNTTTVCEYIRCETWYVGHACAADMRVILAIIFANEERRYLEGSSHLATTDRSIDETVESGQMVRRYQGASGPLSEISEDDYNSVASTTNLAAERVYNKKTLVKRSQNNVPEATGRGGTHHFGQESSTKVTKKDTKAL